MQDHPLANGIRTQHPIPGLPFVDDSLLDLTDPLQIERIGRGRGQGLWGREDTMLGSDTDWIAFTTIPSHPHLAWVVRHYQRHGTTVTLVADDDAAGFHELRPDPVLTRCGGYWWDGAAWYRPGVTYDTVMETAIRQQPVHEAETLTVADVVKGYSALDPKPLTPLDEISTTPPSAHEPTALWVTRHLSGWLAAHPETEAWSSAVVTLRAPEVETGRMLPVSGVADYCGLSAATIRAYLAREQMPPPQTRTPALMWASPVIGHWRESIAGRQEPDVPVDESTSILQEVAADLMRTASGLGRFRRRPDPETARSIVASVSRHFMGPSNSSPGFKAQSLAHSLAGSCDKVLDDTVWFKDQAIDNLVLLIETDPTMAASVVTRTIRLVVERAQETAETMRLQADTEFYKAEAMRLQALIDEGDDRSGAEDPQTAQQAHSCALAELRLAEKHQNDAEAAQERVADGTARQNIELALRNHPTIRARDALTEWMNYVMAPKAL